MGFFWHKGDCSAKNGATVLARRGSFSIFLGRGTMYYAPTVAAPQVIEKIRGETQKGHYGAKRSQGQNSDCVVAVLPQADINLWIREGAPQGVVSSTNSRSFSGCTGRALPANTAWKSASWVADSSTGVVITSQRTPSLHGGVVSEPL